MDSLDTLLIALVSLLVVLWAIAPLVVRLTFRHDLAPRLVERATPDLPDVIAAFVEPRVDELTALGFVDCGRASLAAMRGSAIWFAVMRSDVDEVMVCISVGAVPAAGSAPRLHLGQVEYATMWPDGREILTTNLAEPLAVDPLPEHDLLQVPDEHDLARLLEIHTARVARSGRTRPANPAAGREWPGVETALVRTLEHQVERGWFWRDEARGVYRATLPGAWHMTTRMLFPYVLLGRRRIARRAQHALATLGLHPPGLTRR